MVEYEDIETKVTQDISDIKNKIIKKDFIVGDAGSIIKEILENMFILDDKLNKLNQKINKLDNRLIVVENKLGVIK